MIARHEFRRARLTDEPWATAPSIVVGHKRPAGELRRSAVNSLQGDTHFICPSLFSTHPARLLLRLIRKSCRSPGRSLSGRTCRNPEAALAIVRFQPRRGTSPVQFRPPLLPLSRRPNRAIDYTHFLQPFYFLPPHCHCLPLLCFCITLRAARSLSSATSCAAPFVAKTSSIMRLYSSTSSCHSMRLLYFKIIFSRCAK